MYKAKIWTPKRTSFKRTSRPYIVNFGSMYRVNIESSAGNSWHPLVTFYDSAFNAIEVIEKESLERV